MTTTEPKIVKINDLYVIEQQYEDDPGQPYCIYWPDGYQTLAEAQAAIRANEYGENNPVGVPVEMNTGYRRR